MDSRHRPGSGSSYCPNCGEELSPSANFCPDCGTSRETGSQPGARSRSDRDGLEFRVTKDIEDGWEVEHDFGDRVVLIRRSFGSTGTHLLIGFFTIWWTMGIGNALYAAYCYYGNAERRVLRAGEVDRSNEPAARAGNSAHETVESSSSRSLGTTILLWAGALIMVAAAQASATILWTVIFGAVAVVLALSGTSSLSPVRRRLEKRQSITDNGWTRSVRERSVVNPDESCAACAGHVDRGVKRTYSTEFAVLGVPLTTDERGTNYYCRQCANGEIPMAKLDPDSVSDSDSDSDSDSELESDSDPNPDSELESDSDSDPELESDSDSDSDPESDSEFRSKRARESDLRSNRNRDSNPDRLERSDADGDQNRKRSQHADRNRTKDDSDTSVDRERTTAGYDSDREHDRNTELS